MNKLAQYTSILIIMIASIASATIICKLMMDATNAESKKVVDVANYINNYLYVNSQPAINATWLIDDPLNYTPMELNGLFSHDCFLTIRNSTFCEIYVYSMHNVSLTQCIDIMYYGSELNKICNGTLNYTIE